MCFCLLFCVDSKRTQARSWSYLPAFGQTPSDRLLMVPSFTSVPRAQCTPYCLHGRVRHAKTYQRANNVGVKKILSGVKSLQNVRCFVGKVSYGADLRFLVAFFGTFVNFMLLFWIFFNTIQVLLTFYAVLLRIRFFFNALFWLKYFWLKPFLCKKIVFLHIWVES